MNTKIIIDIPLNTIYLKENNYRGLTQEWIDYRMNLFMNYTAKSLINQTDQDFLCVVHCERTTMDKVNNALAKYPPLPSNIIFSVDGDYIIKEAVKGYDYVYKLRLDSDNVVHPTYVSQLKKVQYYDGLQVIIGRYGYIYEISTNRLGFWDDDSSAFNAYVFTATDYIRLVDEDDRFAYIASNTVESHPLAKNLNHQYLYSASETGRVYFIVVHGDNLANFFVTYGEVENEDRKDFILKDFHIDKKQ